MNLSNNIFKYATSELSQDAFICWFLSHLLEENKTDNPITMCATEFVKLFFPTFTDADYIDEISQQYKKIDVLIRIENSYIIIEDKTFTNEHDGQINKYKKILVDEGKKESDIICVYYKIFEQAKEQNNVNFEFTRNIIMGLFGKYIDKIDNPIFKDYYYYLSSIDERVNAFSKLPMNKWDGEAFVGFYKHLQNGLLADYDTDWDYVSNPSGGFMGMWWTVLTKDELNKMGLYSHIIESLYPQIEEQRIGIKISMEKELENSEKELTTRARWKIYEYFKSKFGDDFEKTVYRFGKYMTIGYLNLSEDNYEEVIRQVLSVIKNMPNDFIFVNE